MPNSLWFYAALARLTGLNYRGKILLIAFLGTHVPLLTLIGWFLMATQPDWSQALHILGVALAATLAGTALTLFVIDHLLRPILLTGGALRGYVNKRTLPELPVQFTDEAGRLMADASYTLNRLDETIDRLANYDVVTGLPNRTFFVARLAEALHEKKETEEFGVVALRVRGAGRVGATFGQESGDEVMRIMARRLIEACAHKAVIAHIEPECFALMIERDGGPDAVAEVVRPIAEALAAPVVVNDIEARPDIAAGIALSPCDGTEAEALVDNAVAALAMAGESAGTSRVGFFSERARGILRERFVMEQDLRRAVARDELFMVYQPVVDLQAGRVVGAEALVRWQHPERGLVSPGVFIPLAEQTGLIDEIGRWTFDAATRQIRTWRDQGLEDLGVAVNLSAKQLRDPGLLAWIGGTLGDAGLTKGDLEIELTETATMGDTALSSQVFGQLREMGVRIALDDFGTGYSSLAYLRTLPFDRLKIDRAFANNAAADPRNRAICQSVIALAEGLGLEILAEGVEEDADIRTLVRANCWTFQGFAFSKPLQPADFAAAVGRTGWLTDRIATFDGVSQPLRAVAS